ncbi:TraB/VirB10 family protein [Vibrio navarrensis]|nr:TraB/VirB10 family protein [Vibrio navarrensis]
MKNVTLVGLFAASITGCTVGQNELNCSVGDENKLCGSSPIIYEKTNDAIDGDKQQDLNEAKSPESSTPTISEISGHVGQSNSSTYSSSYNGEMLRIPSGSILSGVLVTGLDVKTTAKAANDPVPVLVRIKKESILPNYQAIGEIKECFAFMAGYGDLTLERVMLRGESISCVKHDKTVIEANFKSFAVGEDGKNGLKGTLVTRNSAVLANSMMQGFTAGLASMFDVSPSTDNSGKQQYQELFKTGSAKETSNAMNKLADYYMQLADSTYPVIEIGAGRVVDMIVMSATELAVSERKKG